MFNYSKTKRGFIRRPGKCYNAKFALGFRNFVWIRLRLFGVRAAFNYYKVIRHIEENKLESDTYGAFLCSSGRELSGTIKVTQKAANQKVVWRKNTGTITKQLV